MLLGGPIAWPVRLLGRLFGLFGFDVCKPDGGGFRVCCFDRFADGGKMDGSGFVGFNNGQIGLTVIQAVFVIPRPCL